MSCHLSDLLLAILSMPNQGLHAKLLATKEQRKPQSSNRTAHPLSTTQQNRHKHSPEPTRADMVSAGRPSSLSDVVNLAADCE